MALDYSVLQGFDPAGAFFRGQEAVRAEQERNMLRQMQMEQMQAQRQRQQVEFEQSQEDRRRRMEQEGQFQKLAGLISQHGMDPDDPKVLGEFAQAALLSGQPQLSSVVSSMAERAAKRRAAAAEARQIGDILGPRATSQNAMARPAPMVNALAAPQPAMQSDLLAGTPFAIGPLAAPQAAAPMGGPVAAPPDNAARVAELERQRDALEALGTPAALAQAKRLDRQLERLAPKEVAPPADVATMRALGIPITPEGAARFYAMKRPEAPKVDVKVAAFTPASEQAQQDYIKGISEERKALRNAPDTLANVARARALVPGAKGFMGTGGEPLMRAASFLNNRLGFSISTQGVADATELRTRLFDGILDNLKRLDSQPSQEQQRVMQEALGTLGTDPEALPRILDKIEETVRGRVARYNEDVTDAEARGVKFPFKPQIKISGGSTGPAAIPGAAPAAPAAAKQIRRTGTLNGRKVVEYTDGSVAYAD